MILRRLIEDIQRIAAKVHPLTETNAGAVEYQPEHGVVFELADAQHSLDLIEDEKTGSKNLEESLKAAESELKDLSCVSETLQKMLDEVREEEAPGATIRHYREECEMAREHAHAWRIAYKDMKAELTRLRKRKGITTGFVQYEREILEKLRSLPDCEALVNKINLSSTL